MDQENLAKIRDMLSYELLADSAGRITTGVYQCKSVFIGESGVGKTQIVNRFHKKDYVEEHLCTDGVKLSQQKVLCDNVIINVHIWDCSGDYEQRAMAKMYLKGAKVAFLVYDITDENSFTSLDPWAQELKECPEMELFYLVGTKADKEAERVITHERAVEYAKAHGIQKVFETSAKEKKGLQELFACAAKEFVAQKRTGVRFLNHEDNPKLQELEEKENADKEEAERKINELKAEDNAEEERARKLKEAEEKARKLKEAEEKARKLKEAEEKARKLKEAEEKAKKEKEPNENTRKMHVDEDSDEEKHYRGLKMDPKFKETAPIAGAANDDCGACCSIF